MSLTAIVIALAQMAAPVPTAGPPQQLAPGVALLPGSFEPGRGPDGNTVVFDAPDGLIVVDTGRHGWHSDAILAYAARRGRPVAAIINTHWHLDHSSGNGRIRAAHPGARVYTTRAVEGVLAEGGFLERNFVGARAMLENPALPALQREEVQIFIETMAERQILLPDVAIERSGWMRIAGRRFDVRVTNGAVTEADVWLYDRRSRVAVIGDLVTFPAPFFETACPDQWRVALDEVWATPFRIVIPGHGAPMTREQFGVWRAAFGAFLDCVKGPAEASVCAAAWARDIDAFLMEERARRAAPQMATYYVTFLRENGGRSPDCRV